MMKVNSALSEKILERARVELREDDVRKSQSLAQFREWLSKHPFIKKCRQDDVYLLQFLRTKKYSNAAAYKLLENHLTAKMLYPKWFIYGDSDVLKMRELYKTGYIYPLLERDEEGRKIILCQVRKMDPTKYNSGDIIRLSALIVTTLLEDHETQISGFIGIMDYAETTMKHIGVFSITDVKDYVNCVKNATVGRFKAVYSVNLPPFAHFLMDIAKNTANEKIRSRIHLPKNNEELKTLINPALLPKEYGGTIPEAVMMEQFGQLVVLNDDNIKKSLDYEIDSIKVPQHQSTETEVVGSFRKLDID